MHKIVFVAAIALFPSAALAEESLADALGRINRQAEMEAQMQEQTWAMQRSADASERSARVLEEAEADREWRRIAERNDAKVVIIDGMPHTVQVIE